MAGERLPASMPVDKQSFRSLAKFGSGKQDCFELNFSAAEPPQALCKPLPIT